ncbi:hypothetical protein CBL_20443 [Carabus blaptoides fortunei]
MKHHIQTQKGLPKPDIVARKSQELTIIDVQIVLGAKPLSKLHQDKALKYVDLDVLEYVKTNLDIPPEAVSFTSCTISWRGVWVAESYQDLAAMGLPNRTLEDLTTRVLQEQPDHFPQWKVKDSQLYKQAYNRLSTIRVETGSTQRLSGACLVSMSRSTYEQQSDSVSTVVREPVKARKSTRQFVV